MALSWAGGDFAMLARAADGMRVQRFVLDLAARNVAAAQASTPDHPYARLVADAAAPDVQAPDDTPADTPFDDPQDAIADDGATPLPDVRREAGTGDALTEMIAVLDAQRAYEQNASLFDVGKRLAERTIDIERG